LSVINRVDGDVARPGNRHGRPVHGRVVGFEHLVNKHDHTVTGGLGTDQRTAPGNTFTGKHTGFKSIRNAAVLPEQVPDLTGSDADIAGGDVGIFANVAVQLGHERLAEPHDLTFGPTGRVEICATLPTADRHPGQGVFEYLLEA